MITPLLQTALEPVIDRHRSLRRLRWLVLGLVLLTIAAAMVATRVVPIPDKKLLAVLLIIGIYGVARIAGRRWQPDFRGIARRIEEQHPELHALLITAVEQKPDPKTGKFNFLQQRVDPAGRRGRPQCELARCRARLALVELAGAWRVSWPLPPWC